MLVNQQQDNAEHREQANAIKNAINLYNNPEFHHKMSPSFISKSHRFVNNVNLNPGPGSYLHKQSLKSQTKKLSGKDQQQQPIYGLQNEWILHDGRDIFIKHSDVPGPGSYDYQTQHNNNTANRVISWAKNIKYKSISQKQLDCNVGPGSYEVNVISSHQQSALSAFKSKIPQCKNIVQKQQKTDKKNIIINALIKENIQDKKITAKNRNKQSYIFASKIDRFDTVQDNMQVGPGSYDSQKERKIKHILPKVKGNERKYKMKQYAGPGPGTYEVKQNQLKSNIEQKGNPISRSTRFQKILPIESPGPGQYMKNRFQFIKEDKISTKKRKKIIKSESSFSKDNQQNYQTSKMKNSQRSNYQLKTENISHRLQKKIEHIKRLKAMKVEIPAFNINQKRFN